MTIKSILTAASGGSANDGAAELACRLARRFAAHLEGFHVRIDPSEALTMAADAGGFGVPMAGQWIEQMTADAAARADKTKAAFAATVARHEIPMVAAPPAKGASAAWREEVGYAPRLVAERARFFDLVVLGRSERVVEQPYSDTIEETLLRSGRPLLLAPARAPASIGERVAIGWDGSAQAVRALTISLPLVRTARTVTVITVGDRELESVGAVVDYFGWHGVTARHRSIPVVAGAGVGPQLLSAARDEAADLLVMGGYGHMPWREFLFGGATRDIVGVSLLPLLLAH